MNASKWVAQGKGIANAKDAVVREDGRNPVGIIDIGSNSVRLVVYEGETRTPVPMFNEKVACALGKGMNASGVLDPEGRVMAVEAICRYVGLAKAMGVARLDILATAATRDASDGPEFVAELEAKAGIQVKVCSGAEEAELAALGVLCATPEANGMVADLGGGSLELVMVGDHKIGDYVTMPLGVLRLSEAADNDYATAPTIVDNHLSKVGWLNQLKGRDLYAVGGAWRALARVIIEQRNYPLHVLDNYTLPAREALQLIDFISHLSRKSLEGIGNVSKRRMDHLPFAAAILRQLIVHGEPKRLVFSVWGMREGNFFRTMPPEVRAEDPLIAAARRMACQAGRFPEHGDELMRWMDPLFVDEIPNRKRLRLAACLMGDTFWREHPDYRAEMAFLNIMRLPFMGLEHRDRAGIAMAVYHRYKGDKNWDMMQRASGLLSEERLQRVETIGLALRLAHNISGGAPHILKKTSLRVEDGKLILSMPDADPTFHTDGLKGRFDKLAKNQGLVADVEWV